MESFSEACENAQIRFLPGGFAPLNPLPGLCPGPTGGLGGPLHPRPNLLFSKMTLLFHFIMKTLPTGQVDKEKTLHPCNMFGMKTLYALKLSQEEPSLRSNIIIDDNDQLYEYF